MAVMPMDDDLKQAFAEREAWREDVLKGASFSSWEAYRVESTAEQREAVEDLLADILFYCQSGRGTDAPDMVRLLFQGGFCFKRLRG